MPKYKTHLVGGLVTFFLVKKSLDLSQIWKINLSTEQTIILLFFSLFGSLFPDIDTKSKIQKIFYSFIFLGLFILLINKSWILLGFSSLIALLPLLVNHRGIFHKFWFIASLAIILGFLSEIFFHKDDAIIILSVLFFTSGAFSHIALDYGILRFIKRKILK